MIGLIIESGRMRIVKRRHGNSIESRGDKRNLPSRAVSCCMSSARFSLRPNAYFFCKGLCSCKPIANLHLDQSKADQIFSECITLLKVQPRP